MTSFVNRLGLGLLSIAAASVGASAATQAPPMQRTHPAPTAVPAPNYIRDRITELEVNPLIVAPRGSLLSSRSTLGRLKMVVRRCDLLAAC